MPCATASPRRTVIAHRSFTHTAPVVALALCVAAAWGAPERAAAQRMPADDVGYAQGEDTAPVRVVELLDFGCPACALFAAETFPLVRDRYVRTGQVRWQVIPFVLGSFRHSSEAARAAACAAEQGAFWPMHDLLFARRSAWIQTRDPEAALLDLARELALDADAFQRCYRSEAARKQVDRQTLAARRMGVRGTPTLVIDGERIAGALDVTSLSGKIEARLGR